MSIKKLTLIILILIISVQYAFALRIDVVDYEGNKRIPSNRIEPHLVKPNKELDLALLNESIKKLYDTGFFLNVDADLHVDGDKFVLTYRLQEMPLVAAVIFNGNKELKLKEFLDEIPLKKGGVLKMVNVERTMEKLREKYEEENRYGTKITFRLESRTINSVEVHFDIEEAKKSKIYNIIIYGNDNVSRDDILSVMPTKERGFWSFISSSGKIQQEMLDADRELIRLLYLEKGYAKVNVSQAELVVHEDDPSMVDVIYRVKEGSQYRVRSVDIAGYETFGKDNLTKYVLLKPKEIFNIKMYQEDIKRLTSFYTTKGYAYANVEPVTTLDDETLEVDLTYKIEENILVKVGRINISGNDITNDNVVRREIDQMEGALYNSDLIEQIKANTMATGYFSDVEVAEKTDPDNKDIINIDVNVKEQSTGTFTIGAAYSTIDGLLGMIQLSRNNFMGWGHTITLRAEVSQKRLDFYGSYNVPWFFDWPVNVGFDLYSMTRTWYEYTRDMVGGGIRVGHALIKRRLYMNYRFSIYRVDIYDITTDASKYIKEQEGKMQFHVFSPSLVWSNINNPNDPTRGNKTQLYFDLGGTIFGGDAHYFKVGLDSTQYIPIALDGDVGFLVRAALGYVIPTRKGVKVPIDERFRLGGINTIRGFDYGYVSPLDEEGKRYGGNKFYQLNLEFIFPIKRDIRLKGVLFFDTGQSLSEKEDWWNTMPRFSVGIGLRWITPMGPFRIEWGYNLTQRGDEVPFKFDFSIGGTF